MRPCIANGCSCSSWLDREFFISSAEASLRYKREEKPFSLPFRSTEKHRRILSCLGSPFGVNVMDTQRVVVFGKGLGSVPVNVPASFTILTQNAGVGDLRCSIKGGVAF